MKLHLPATAAAALIAPLCASASAAEMSVNVEVPSLDVAEYHRPYVAMWLQTPDGKPAVNLAVWYDVKLRNDEGEDWLKDLRQWWRRIGRNTDMPVDGVSGPTRAPGGHDIAFEDKLNGLAPGEYEFMIEAVREVGGRELLHGTLQWPPKEETTLRLEGERELGPVILTLKP